MKTRPKQKFKIEKSKSHIENKIIEKSIESLIAKGAVVPCSESKNQYISPYFVVPKPDGSYRFILNLKRFNRNVHTQHFKLEDLNTTIKLISQGDFLNKIDLKDAFFLVPIKKSSQKYLKFKFNNKYFKFVCLPFGLSTSPYVFTKLMKPVMQYLRERGIVAGIFIDDILNIAGTYEECRRNAEIIISLLTHLGFIINKEKSDLVPKKICTYLGFNINTKNCSLTLTDKKKSNLVKLLNSVISKEQCTIYEFAKIIGKLISACTAVEYGWLYTKVMEREKIIALRSNFDNYNKKMRISNKVKEDIKWWIKAIPTALKYFKPKNHKVEIFTDASLSGWGATKDKTQLNGFWKNEEKGFSINYLELLAIKKALERLGETLHNCKILLRVDNKTAISYINKMGGVRYDKYNRLARSIWQWAEDRKIILRASYIPSKENTIAGTLSRINLDTEWEIFPYYYEKITKQFGIPEIDLFATATNKKCSKYASWLPDAKAHKIDAFTMNWKNMYFYAFPPFSLIAKVIEKVRLDKATGILVVPNWKNQPWYPIFCRLVISKKLILGPNNNLLYISSSQEVLHPRARYLQLIAAVISGKHF